MWCTVGLCLAAKSCPFGPSSDFWRVEQGTQRQKSGFYFRLCHCDMFLRGMADYAFPTTKGKCAPKGIWKGSQRKEERGDVIWYQMTSLVQAYLPFSWVPWEMHHYPQSGCSPSMLPHTLFPLPLALNVFRNSHLFASLVSITSVTLERWGKPSVSSGSSAQSSCGQLCAHSSLF